jgi:putative transposase
VGHTHLCAGRPAPPRYRKQLLADSFRYPQGCKLDGRQVYVPRIDWVAFWHSRAIEGAVKHVTVSRPGIHWYVAWQVEQDLPEPLYPAVAEGGIDLGVATFAAFSDSPLHPPLNAYRRREKKKARMQRKLAGMGQYAQTWQKQQHRMARLDMCMANCRHDFRHTLATETSTNHAVIVIEALQVAHRSRSAPGTGEVPERHVAAKAGVKKASLDQGWGMFRRMLEYKQAWRGAR